MTHAQLGAYLLALWGLPDEIVQIVEYHDFPSLSPHESNIQQLLLVHVAQGFDASGNCESPLDAPFLERAGFSSDVEHWQGLLKD